MNKKQKKKEEKEANAMVARADREAVMAAAEARYRVTNEVVK